MKLKIGKGDTVEVTAGSDKGKRGAVLFLDSNKLKIRIQGVRMQTHFDKENGKSVKEGLIDYSNVKLIEKAKKKTASKSSSKSK